ncbi:hypothetical protein [Halorubrum distributum]|jgi:hypothetical protein|uniref:Uncharacterized protein n=1 Tax=Halorubrum distributum TaxID=29283 RepID=A0A6B1IM41_9EURY|nr:MULTISPECIES: hypothetical protein [Halorubrum distributum group]MYL16154.1 hypothetical protein [Halorubrum terrestre]MYL67682.1 hypothetical protein [Halorubrum terrestre]PHQ47763.1 hypothetical protein DJ68_00115 [Halorubrum sp. C3]
MAARNNRSKSGSPATLPDVVPFDLSHLTRQSWELGNSTVQDEQAAILGKWTHQNNQWRLSIFEITSETAIICIRTPVGRERFYGAIQSELKPAIQKLEVNPSWQQVR